MPNAKTGNRYSITKWSIRAYWTEPEYAITGTCIAFKDEEERCHVTTYLIFNKAWQESKWMFPGGHAFIGNNDTAPDTIAKAKAKDEAGLDVSMLDLHQSGSSSRGVKVEDKTAKGRSMTTLSAPHYTYLFSLTESVKCYSRGHRFHYDLVYVGEVLNVFPTDNATLDRIQINLPRKCINQKELENIVHQAIRDYVNEKGLPHEDSAFGDYVIKMLYEAHKDYVKHLNTKKGA